MLSEEISLIISTYEKPEVLNQVLRGLERQIEFPGEILIADDGSGPITGEVIARWRPKLRAPLQHVWHPDDGFRKTIILNRTIAAAKGNYIVFLDGDCVPDAHFIHDHARLAERDWWVQGRRCFIREQYAAEFAIGISSITGWILQGRIKGWTKIMRLPFPLISRNTGQRGIIGCNMGIWRDDLLAVNGLDEEFLGWGGEDSDLGNRLYHLGRKRKFVYGRAMVYHLDHPLVDRSRYDAGKRRLAETIRSGKVRCERGISQYLTI